MTTMTSRLVQATGAFAGAAGAFVLLSRGDLAVDTGIGRRYRALGPMRVRIAAPPATVFDVVAEPYLRRTPHAMQDKLEVWERGVDMALAAHRTRTRWFTTTTVEAVRFERPHRITFRLARGPVPHVAEVFELRAAGVATDFEYHGELGTDFWILGALWGDVVARQWQRTVHASIAGIREESERRARRRS